MKPQTASTLLALGALFLPSMATSIMPSLDGIAQNTAKVYISGSGLAKLGLPQTQVQVDVVCTLESYLLGQSCGKLYLRVLPRRAYFNLSCVVQLAMFVRFNRLNSTSYVSSSGLAVKIELGFIDIVFLVEGFISWHSLAMLFYPDSNHKVMVQREGR